MCGRYQILRPQDIAARFETVNAPVVAAAIPDAVDLRDMHVLVVDDNATNQRLLGQFLLAWGMVPTLAAGVSEALTALRAAQESGSAFPLLITDYQMPDVDGLQATAGRLAGYAMARLKPLWISLR